MFTLLPDAYVSVKTTPLEALKINERRITGAL
jgi:hypothetical protein